MDMFSRMLKELSIRHLLNIPQSFKELRVV